MQPPLSSHAFIVMWISFLSLFASAENDSGNHWGGRQKYTIKYDSSERYGKSQPC